MRILQITNLPSISGLTWRQISLLVACSVLIGIDLALIISLPAH